MVAKHQVSAKPKGSAAKAADDIAAVRGIASAADGESARDFERTMQAARRVMRENRGILRELAK